jgi:hypothetical protein
MNLFRSEEHIRNWARFDPATAEGILPLEDVVRVFSGNMFRRRLDPDYVTHCGDYLREFVGDLAEIAKIRPFWSPGGV